MKKGDVVYLSYKDHCTLQGVYPKQAEDTPVLRIFVYGKVVKIEKERVLIQCYGEEPVHPSSSCLQSFYVWVLKSAIVQEKVLIEGS